MGTNFDLVLKIIMKTNAFEIRFDPKGTVKKLFQEYSDDHKYIEKKEQEY